MRFRLMLRFETRPRYFYILFNDSIHGHTPLRGSLAGEPGFCGHADDFAPLHGVDSLPRVITFLV
jgi:hypothetical protein